MLKPAASQQLAHGGGRMLEIPTVAGIKASPVLGAMADNSDIALLSISGSRADHDALEQMLDPSWAMEEAFSAAAALAALRRRRFGVIVWDRDSMGSEWRNLAAECASSVDAPNVIVSSRLADASLWAEALNVGAWDVLAKPYDSQEVSRVLTMARAHCAGHAMAAYGGD